MAGEDKQEKWREAINKWTKWSQSIKDAKALVKRKYGNLDEIGDRVDNLDYDRIYGTLTDEQRKELGQKGLLRWDCVVEIEKIGSDFISNEIGLHPSTIAHGILLDYWKYLVHPDISGYSPDEVK